MVAPSRISEVLSSILCVDGVKIQYQVRLAGPTGSKGNRAMTDLLQLSGIELGRRIREGDVSSTEVVERHIEQITRVNARINAVVRDRFEQARVEAKQADERIRAGDSAQLPPLLGVPCTIKESIALSGMPNSSGMLSRAHLTASEDATAVARVRSAGAIPLGVTNVPELTVWAATFNRVYGRTNNAYDSRRIAGGSSGGEGAIIGAGASPFGIGTDLGGSIRAPAFCNGVFGHKPSGGLVPGTGQYPQYEGRMARFNTTGPLARRAEDLMPLLRIMAGPDGRDAGCVPYELGDPDGVDLSALRVLVIEDDGRRPGVVRELRYAQQRAAYALARRGASVDLVSVPDLEHSLLIWAALFEAAGGTRIGEALGGGERTRPGREIARWALGRSPHTYPPLLLPLVESLGRRLPRWSARYAERGARLLAQLDDLLGEDGVILYPSGRSVAPRHGPTAPLNFRFFGIFNPLELPVTQVPLGLSEEGLPLGVQVVARRGNDHLTISVALELERALGGWVRPIREIRPEPVLCGSSRASVFR
jgi:fatty acid amide hydrolase 2